MERDSVAHVGELIHESYRAGVECESFLTHVWSAALAAVGCAEGLLSIRGLGCVYASGGGRVVEFTAERDGALEQPAPFDVGPAGVERAALAAAGAHTDGPHAAARRRPLLYRGEPIGELTWSAPGHAPDAAADEFFALLARELVYVVKRYEVAGRARDGLGHPLLLVGLSDELRRLERQIEKAAAVDLPVLVQGEFGCEKLHVAYAVHACSDRRDGAFVEVKCGAQRARSATVDPGDWFRKARGGSLFFNGIDELDSQTQAVLPEYVASCLGQWGRSSGTGDGPPPRVMASSTRDLRVMVQQGDFSRSLFAELDFLNLVVPALRQRRGDLPPLVQYTFGKYRRRPEQGLSAESLHACTRYDWPENVFEVERAMARLAAMADSEEISLDALRQVAPEIAGAAPAAACLAPYAAPPGASAPAGGHGTLVSGPARGPALVAPEPVEPSQPTMSADEVVRQVAERDYVFGGGLHPCLRKALRHIGDNFDQPISLGLLAEKACVSPSHLSFLFRTHLGVTFKSFLAAVRIEKAKRLLAERADLKITDISLDVGFGDLSHFEKTFKRLACVNPREYRRQRWEQ